MINSNARTRYHKWIAILVFTLPLLAGQDLAFAQQRLFTLKEAILGLQGELRPATMQQPSWEPGTDYLYQVQGKGKQSVWERRLYPSPKKDTAFSLETLASQTPGLDSLKSMPKIQWISQGRAWFLFAQQVYIGQSDTANNWTWERAFSIPSEAKNLNFDGASQWAYTLDQNLWLQPLGEEAWPITQEPNPHIVSGSAVHREEFGIKKGIFFSPSGRYLAYYRMDETMVDDYPIIDWSGSMARVRTIKYPMSGQTSHQVRLFIVDTRTRQTTEVLSSGPKDQYLVSVTWAPNEQSIFIGLLSRDQRHLQLNQYNRETGTLKKTLFEEKHEKYVEPQDPLYFIPGHADYFVWRSQRDGFHHLYLYNTEGKLIRRLTEGPWVVDEIVGFSQATGEILFLGNRETPLGRNLYSVHWETGQMKIIEPQEGYHFAWASSTGRYVLNYLMGPGKVGVYLIHGISDNMIEANQEVEDPLASFQRARVEVMEIEAEDGTTLYGKLVLPAQLDSSRRYPLIVYLYNGPHAQLVTHRYPQSGNLWYEYLCQKGYLVFFMDGRGSSRRGRAFEQSIFRNLGKVEMEDQRRGIEALKALPFVDSQRLGVHGWSYGGFMATSLMVHHPGLFKAAVAGGPVLDWSAYEVMYTERYMDRPQDNPEGYKQSNLIDQVGQIQDPLLLIHGSDDDVVLWQHSLKFLKSAVDQGVQVDYFVYPGHGHNVRGKDRVHLYEKITSFFDQHLQPEKKP